MTIGHEENSFCKFDYEQLRIINVYKNPRTTLSTLKELLENNNDMFNHDIVLFMGDFNEHFEQSTGFLETYLHTKFGLKIASPREPTTDNLTIIDAIFSKLTSYFIESSYNYESFKLSQTLDYQNGSIN